MNSAKDRRVNDGVSSRSKHLEPAPPQARSWPADNLSSDLSQQPQISNRSSRREIAFDLAHLWPKPRLACKLNGGGTQPTHNYTGNFRARTSPAPSHRTIIAIAPAVEVNEQGLLQATFQERQIKTWQKN
ncbi:MAG TPA: hypothetical protein VFH15_01005 [Pyrinomonadaceae bacterium]|nr:hypothetical protein [Pyrinomonadaceae bacterium]